MFDWAAGIVAFLFGASLGSFLNVVIDRVPAGKSLIAPPSHCDSCGAKLGPLELIPVLSYLALRGRCRRCGAKVPVRVFIVEVTAGAGASLTILSYGPGWTFAIVYFAGLALLGLSVIDLEQGIVPHEILIPSFALGLAAAMVSPQMGWKSALLGGAVSFTVLLIPALVRPGGIGWGDVKLAPFIGIVDGFPGVLVALLTSFVVGGAASIVLVLARKGNRKTALPFVPFLAVGAMVGLIWGEAIVRWYLALF